MSSTNSLSCLAIQRWEEAGASLLTAFKNYADLCINIETKSLKEGTKPQDLASRIETMLDTVNATISDQLPKVTATLTHARNKCASRILYFPEEVLLEIFANFVFGRYNSNGSQPLSMTKNVRHIYKRLYILCGACSMWRDIVMARGALWSVIPMIGVPPDYNLAPYELSLCRAGKSPLHLVATILSYDTGVKIEEIFSQYGPRFRTINLSKDTDIVHPEIFTGLLHHCVAGSLSELSIKDSMSRHTLYNNEYYTNIDTIPDCEPGEHTFPPNAPQTASFLKILGSLTAFRIRGFLLPWRDINFSSRLVQLHIEGIRLGYDHTIAPFLQALSSASELRDLKIISVVSFHKDNTTSAENALPIVTLPKLRSFHLQDLYFNTLRVLLSKITPGLPCLTLSLSFKSVEINRIKEITWGNNGNNDIGDDDSIPTIGELWAALGPIQADTLRIGEGSRAWLDGPMIRTFVRAMPILKTLQMDDWFFSDEDNSILSNLIRSHNTQSDQDGLIPALENIHLTRFALNNAEILQEMVSSHPVQQIILGGIIKVIESEGIESFDPLEEDNDLVKWLRSNVPDVHLVESEYYATELYSSEWQLW